MVETDLELARLMCTRLCHDLAGPVGAVAAGVELIGSDPEQVDEETLALIGDSSAAASRKLKFMRAALGVATGPSEDIKGLLDGYLDATASMGGRVTVNWPASSDMSVLNERYGADANQAVINLCLLAIEAVPGCQSLSLAINTSQAPLTLVVEAAGDPRRAFTLREDMQSAAHGTDAHPISAKNVQAFVTGQLVRALGGALEVVAQAHGVGIAATFSDTSR